MNQIRPHRRGLSLLEVLISMGILVVGLLGAAAMFPVGGYFMQKGDIADRGSAIARAALADLVARDALNPQDWMGWNGAANGFSPMAWALRSEMNANLSNPTVSTAGQVNLNAMAAVTTKGHVFVLDPLAISQMWDPNAPARSQAMTYAPFNAGAKGLRWQLPDWPVRRCTHLRGLQSTGTVIDQNGFEVAKIDASDSNSSNSGPDIAVSYQLAVSSDDLAMSVGTGEDATQQRWEVGTANGSAAFNGKALARQFRGDYSWVVTIAPTTPEAWQSLATDATTYPFDVSVAVFYKRAASSVDTKEQLLRANVLTTGTGGGEITLPLPVPAGSTYADIKQGEWLMVCGPHSSDISTSQSLTFASWYKVLAIEETTDTKTGDAVTVVGLRGPDWPWKDPAEAPAVGVCVFPGAVAVHTRTIRLSGSTSWQQ